jgi:glycerophosphoryl diester phosphodiesterase
MSAHCITRAGRCLRRGAAVGAICLYAGGSGALEIVAHRGGYALTPENTLAAFRSCAGIANGIEFDVHATADGHLVVMHDPTVNRTTGGSGSVSNLTLAQIKTLDAGAKFSPAFAGEPIPTLAEALRTLPPGIRPIIDRKSGSANAYVDIIRAETAVSNVMLSAFEWPFLEEVHAIEPRIALSAIGSGTISSGIVDWLKYRGIYNVSWEKASVTSELTGRLHANGIRLFAWSFDGPEIPGFLNMGIDGLIVKDPQLAVRLLDGTSPANEELATGILAYWKLDDGLNDPAALETEDVERITRGSAGEAGLAPVWGFGDQARMGSALSLDGIRNGVLIPATRQTDIGTNAVTLSLWVKLSVLPSSLTADYAGIYDSENDAYILYLDRQAGELRFKVTDSSLHYARTGIPEAKLGTGVWHHVAGVYDGSASPSAGQTMIYLDGKLISVKTGADVTPNNELTGPVRPGQVAAIGRNGVQDVYYFAGAVDDVAIWGRSLRPADIRRIYAAGARSVPLETLIMTIQIQNTVASTEPGYMDLDFNARHAITADRQFLLLSAPSPAGPFTEHPSEMIIKDADIRCRIPTGIGPSTGLYFRIASP